MKGKLNSHREILIVCVCVREGEREIERNREKYLNLKINRYRVKKMETDRQTESMRI